MPVEWIPDATAGLWGLFASSFLSATLLPGSSEVVLAGLLYLHPDQAMPALVIASVGNTLGGMSTYWLARLIPKPDTPQRVAALTRWGAPALLLSWAPVVGDALCLAAGWLRMPWAACLLFMAIGKTARYALIVAVAT